MRIFVGVAMARKMFAARNDAAFAQPLRPRQADLDDLLRLGAKGAVADDRVRRIRVDVQDRSEIEIDADQFEFFSGGTAKAAGEIGTALLANPSGGGKMSERFG